ncbi:MAG TPA: hypothetical protein VJ991_07205 [Balneolales bacterium]|nr:hypothetical protein [Balneolales bacterium]
MTYKISIFLAVTLISLAMIIPAAAQQSEIQREQSSLKGIHNFYLVINVEGSKRITQQMALNVPDLTNSFKDSLIQSGLHVLDDTERAKANNAPYLYIHINTMDAGRGLIPFNVEIDFYQPVELTLNRSMPTLASTWETSAVGLVSMDQLPYILGSASDLLKEFIRDYNSVNNQL